MRAARTNFDILFPVLTNSGILLKVGGHRCNACNCSVLLYASETWVVKIDGIHRLVKNDNYGKMDLLCQII